MKRLILSAALVAAGQWSLAQANERMVYKAKDVVFYGMDFTFLKFIHSDGFIDKNGKPMCGSLTFKYFTEWNEMFLIEKKKYNITRYFAIPDYTIDQYTVTERNKAYPFATDCITEDVSYAISPSAIAEAVEQYGAPGDTGLGLVLFVESMDKVAGKCKFHVVFFDRADHSVVKSERVDGPPSGMGFRNYWANAFDNALDAGSGQYAKKRKAAK